MSGATTEAVPVEGPAGPRRGLAGQVRRGLTWSTISNVVLRLGNLLFGALMARLVAPEQFGVFAVALTVWMILGSLAEFGLGADLVRLPDYERHIPTVATLGLALSTGLALLMCVLARPLALGFGSEQATSVIQLMSVPLWMIGLSVVPAALLQRHLRQGTVFAIDTTALVLSTGVMVAFAMAGAGPLALALGRLSGQAVTVVLQYAAVRRLPRFGWDRDVARSAVAFGLPLAAANLVAWSVLSLDTLVVARLTSPVQLGLYVLAFNLASWPMSVAGQSVRVVALPAFSRLETAGQRARALVTVSGPIWAISFVMALGLMLMAAQVVELVYGARWLGAVSAVVPLAMFGALRVVFDLLATFLVANGRTRRVFVVQLAWLVALLPALVVGVRVGGLTGAGWAHVAVGAGVVLPLYLVTLRGVEVPWRRFLGAWVMPTLAAVPLGLVLVLITADVSGLLAALGLAALAGTLLYALPLARWWIGTLRSLEVRP